MSQENVEIVRRAIDEFNDGFAPRSFDSFVGCFHPEVEWIEETGIPDMAGLRGVAALKKWCESLTELFESFHIEVERIDETADGALVLGHYLIVGLGSGIPGKQEFGQIYSIRGGSIIRFHSFFERRKALEAVGLTEQDAHADS